MFLVSKVIVLVTIVNSSTSHFSWCCITWKCQQGGFKTDVIKVSCRLSTQQQHSLWKMHFKKARDEHCRQAASFIVSYHMSSTGLMLEDCSAFTARMDLRARPPVWQVIRKKKIPTGPLCKKHRCLIKKKMYKTEQRGKRKKRRGENWTDMVNEKFKGSERG